MTTIARMLTTMTIMLLFALAGFEFFSSAMILNLLLNVKIYL
jgi:hypothetical protein